MKPLTDLEKQQLKLYNKLKEVVKKYSFTLLDIQENSVGVSINIEMNNAGTTIKEIIQISEINNPY